MPRAPRSRSSAVTTFARRVRRRHHGLPCRRWRSRPTRPCPCKAPLPRPPRRLRSPEPTLLSRDWRCSAMAPTAPRTPSRAARPRSTPSSRPTPRSWSSAQSTTWGTPTTSTLIMVRLKSSSNSPLTTLATRSSSRTMVYTRANSRLACSTGLPSCGRLTRRSTGDTSRRAAQRATCTASWLDARTTPTAFCTRRVRRITRSLRPDACTAWTLSRSPRWRRARLTMRSCVPTWSGTGRGPLSSM
mmetsp:Transcript_20124/g.59759  ORF Transcript_20124/g.59759 Transcript_20124/m.59759 type:complete len:244 (-) Transcript_20124:1212-1943(-)